MLKGIDVSEHQGVINWNEVKGNIDFAILRAGWGNNHIDKQFIRNIKECNRLGIPVGAYWFSYALNAEIAKSESRFLLDAVKDYIVEYPLFCDWEGDSKRYAEQEGVKITKRLCTDIVKAFLNEIEGNGYWAANYANPNFINNYFYQSELERYSLWLAWYGTTEDQAKKYGCEMWQYSESGSIQGIGTHSVDMNYDYRNFAKTIRDKGLNHLGNNKPDHSIPSSPNLVSQQGTCTVMVDKLMIREKPSTGSESVGAYYEGDTVVYDYYVDNDGYRWISWVGGSGNRRYMAVRVLETGKRYGNCI